MGKFNYEAVKEAAKQLLVAMGQDVEREGLKETPRRIAGYWQELLEGEEYTNKEIAEKYSKNFEVGYDPIVTIYQENIYSHCEHLRRQQPGVGFARRFGLAAGLHGRTHQPRNRSRQAEPESRCPGPGPDPRRRIGQYYVVLPRRAGRKGVG